MKRTLLNFAAGAMLLLSACNKDAQTGKTSETVQKVNTVKPTESLLVSQALATDPAANPGNPLDSVGQIHNQVLNVVWTYMQSTGDTSITGRRNQVILYFKKRYGIAIGDHLLESEARFKHDFPKGVITVPKGSYGAAGENYLNSMMATVHNINDLGAYGSFKENMMGIEKNILADRTIGITQQQQLLAVASIARYSASFWLQKANTPPAEGVNDTMGFFHNLVKALTVGLIDTCAGAGAAMDGLSIQEMVCEASDASSLWSAFL
jgi:hypothetical protein